MSNFLWLHGLQHTRLFCSPLSTRICSISCTLNLWYLTISSSVAPFSFCPQSFPASESFLSSFQFFTFGGQSTGVSASASVFSMIIQGLCSIGWTGLISQEFSAAPQFKSISSLALSFLYWQTLTSAHEYRKKNISLIMCTFVRKVMSLLFNMLSKFVIVFPLRSKHLLISWLQSSSSVILDLKKIYYVIASTFSFHLPWSDDARCHDLSFSNIEC